MVTNRNKPTNTTAKEIKQDEVVVEDNKQDVEDKPVVETPEKETPKTKSSARPKLDKNETITVVSRARGKLVYKNPRGYKYVFEEKGDELDLEYADVQDMASAGKLFFKKGWVEIVDNDDAVRHFRIEQFANQAFDDEDLENLFQATPENIVEVINSSGTNTKRAIYEYAREIFLSGELNDYKTIKMLEEALELPIDPNK